MVIFEDYGVELLFKGNKYYVRFDAGEIVAKYEEIEITREEAERVQCSEKDAYDVIIWYQNKSMGLL